MGVRLIGKDNYSCGSDPIIKLTDEQDERPIWVLVWGGGQAPAQSIKLGLEIWSAAKGELDPALFPTDEELRLTETEAARLQD